MSKSSRKVKIDGLADAVNEALSGYNDDLAIQVKEAAKEVGDKTAKTLRSTSPKRIGGYAKSWRVKVLTETASEIGVVVHNAKWYMLTHLLEHGHAKRGGGRVAARPHIADAEQAGIEEFMKEIEKRTQNF